MNSRASIASIVANWLRPSNWLSSQDLRGAGGISVIAAGVFLLVAGIGAATSYLRSPSDALVSPHSASDADAIAHLRDYSRSVGIQELPSTRTGGKLLPDVTTMIERLSARLEATPDDIKGWRMLGWSYFQTAHFKQAAVAYGRAVALDPSSAELKTAYEDAKAKASENDNSASPLPAREDSAGMSGDAPSADEIAKYEAIPPLARDAAIKSMVDGLASQLESSPRDVEGWTRLMRSRVVLGEREVAAQVYLKALDVFKDDAAASGKISAAAVVLGLKAE